MILLMTKSPFFKVQTVEYLIIMSFQSTSQTNMISVTWLWNFIKSSTWLRFWRESQKKFFSSATRELRPCRFLVDFASLAAFPFLRHSRIFHIPNLCVSASKDDPKSIPQIPHLNMFSDVSGEECVWRGPGKGKLGEEVIWGIKYPHCYPLKYFKGE